MPDLVMTITIPVEDEPSAEQKQSIQDRTVRASAEIAEDVVGSANVNRDGISIEGP